MFSCLLVDLGIPQCYLFSTALIELVYWSGNNQTVTHLAELIAMGESPTSLLIKKIITIEIINNLFQTRKGNLTSEDEGKQNAPKKTRIKKKIEKDVRRRRAGQCELYLPDVKLE